MMSRLLWLVLAVGFLGITGCKQKTADRSTSGQPSTATVQNPSLPPQATPQQQPQPAPPQAPPRTTKLFFDAKEVISPFVQVRIQGLPADAASQGQYEITSLTNVSGTSPDAVPYYLFNCVATRENRITLGASGNPTHGPFFIEKLPPGSRLTHLRKIGAFEAKMKGNFGRTLGGNIIYRFSVPYVLFEAQVEGP